jgi:hypothetical protein
MNSIAMPHPACSSFSSFEDLRLHGDVERRRRLVGDQQVRLVGERHGDHHALALAARQLVRIGAEPAFRIADADLLQQFETRFRAAARALMQRQHSPTCRSIVCSGLSEVIGSWKIIEMRCRGRRAAPLAPRQQVLALEQDLPAGMRCRRIGSSFSTDSAVTDLPEPLRPPAPPSRPWRCRRRRRARPERRRLLRKATERSRTESSRRSSERLSRIEGVAHRLADEDEQRQHQRDDEEAGEPSHGACRLFLPCAAVRRARASRAAGRSRGSRAPSAW